MEVGPIIRTLIVDDEPLARERIRAMLEGQDDIEVVAECGNGTEAVSKISELSPQLVFLDVQMPEADGFDVAEAVNGESLPVIVFVTAYDQYALKAFDANAVDYLLKPFDKARFLQSLQRVRQEVSDAENRDQERIAALLRDVRGESSFAERFAIKDDGRIFFVRAREIDWIEAAGNYVRLFCGESMHLMRSTMSALEARLDPDRFLRIHRSTIVNLDSVNEIQPLFHGEHVVIMRNGARLTLSRGYRQRLDSLLS